VRKKLYQNLKMKDGKEYPKGLWVNIAPMTIENCSEETRTRISNLPLHEQQSRLCQFCVFEVPDGTKYRTKYTAIAKPPSEKSLYATLFEGACKSISGKKVEPDGHDEFGFPAWSLAMGLV
jgi:hypothetical protein